MSAHHQLHTSINFTRPSNIVQQARVFLEQQALPLKNWRQLGTATLAAQSLAARSRSASMSPTRGEDPTGADTAVDEPGHCSEAAALEADIDTIRAREKGQKVVSLMVQGHSGEAPVPTTPRDEPSGALQSLQNMQSIHSMIERSRYLQVCNCMLQRAIVILCQAATHMSTAMPNHPKWVCRHIEEAWSRRPTHP